MTASLSRLQQFYADMPPLPFLHAMVKQEFAGHIAVLTSFGADAGLLLSMISEIDSSIPVLFLDTGKHFPETLEYGRTLKKIFGFTQVHWLTPDQGKLARIDSSGELWKAQPNRCCWLRKVEPLNRAVEAMGLLALITGRKRYQTPERASMQAIELDEQGIFRINPLASWSKEQANKEAIARAIPPHPLVAKGYQSIGCAPCTVPIVAGQNERAGRWAHTVGIENEQKTECGLHLPAEEMNWST